MWEEIEEIYDRNLDLVKHCEYLVYYFHVQNLDMALRKTTITIHQLTKLLPLYFKQSFYFNEDKERYTEESLVKICRLLLEAQENRDYVLLADYYELYLLPFLYDIQAKVALDERSVVKQFEMNKYKGLQLEYTGSGALTLQKISTSGKRYLHSNKSPYKEALELALSWHQTNKEEYIIYGLGLGYHIAALAEIDKNVTISVYESDARIIKLYEKFGKPQLFFNCSNVHIYHDENLELLLKRIASMSEEVELLFHEPSLSLLPNSLEKELLEEYFIQYSSVGNQLKFLNGNFRRNIKICDCCVDELKPQFAGKTLYLIGAGPSLDKNFMQLKHIPENSILLSTGTAFRKLIKNGIRPDYVIETDANDRIKYHFSDVEKEDVPMILLSTATHELMNFYKGKKYLMFQNGFEKAESYAQKRGYILYETGGSVMTTALDLGIRMSCKKIVFLGLDLAYTDNYAHAAGTSRREIPNDITGLKEVEDIFGNKIYTSRLLNIYRKWIERRIEQELNSKIEFIDATEGGAKIAGTKIQKLKEILG